MREEPLMDMEPQEKPLWGAKAIGDELGLPERKAFYLLEKGLLPARKIGRIWVSTRKELRALVEGGH
jgi:hypothetical protein